MIIRDPEASAEEFVELARRIGLHGTEEYVLIDDVLSCRDALIALESILACESGEASAEWDGRTRPGLSTRTARSTGRPANTGVNGARCSCSPRKVAWVMCIDTMALPASRKVRA